MTRWARHPAAAPVAVAVAALLAWLPALAGRFVADDFTLLETAAAVESPLWPFGHNDLAEDPGSGHFYRPLWVLWHATILELFGDRAGAFHAANLLLFAVVAVLVWALARTLLERGAALVAALAFALYPRHGESVAWVSGSTDLLAVALGLAALLAAVRPASRARLVLPAALAAAAALAKEAAFVLPLLAAVILWALPEERRPPRPVRVPLAMSAALAAVLLARTVVLGGAGGYGDGSLGPGKVAATLASYVTAAFSPPQLELLRHPVLLAVPLALAAAVVVAALRLRGRRRAVAVAGLAWFALALLPVAGYPLDLNNATGERLLLLPSIGLALALGALVPPALGRIPVAGLAALALLLLALCADVARNWVTAGEIAQRVSGQAARAAGPGGTLLVVTIPDSYRSARVFTNSFDRAVRRAGAGNEQVSPCVAVWVREERPGQVRARRQSGGAVRVATGDGAPFDFPVLRDPSPLAPGCSYEEAGTEPSPGLRTGALARPEPPFDSAPAVYFDGRDLRRLP